MAFRVPVTSELGELLEPTSANGQDFPTAHVLSLPSQAGATPATSQLRWRVATPNLGRLQRIDARTAWAHDAHGPGSGDCRRALLCLDRELRAHLGRRGVVEVAPALPPDEGPVLPAPVRSRQQDFQRLGEARLAGSIPADHQRQPRPRRDLQRLRWADSAEAFDGYRAEVGAGRLLYLGCALASRLGAPTTSLAAEGLRPGFPGPRTRPGRAWPTRCPGSPSRSGALFNETEKLGIHSRSVSAAGVPRQASSTRRSKISCARLACSLLRLWQSS